MPYTVVFTPEANSELLHLRAVDRVTIADHCGRFLSSQPTLTSRSRIKRLREGTFPPYRLRVGDFRVYYDVETGGNRVVVYGVVTKSQSEEWLTGARQEHHHEEGDTG